jgi:hypothetical protein
MLSGEDQRRFDQIAHNLQAADPKFVARLDGMPARRVRLLIALCVVMWAAVPVLTVVGGWLAAGGATLLLVAAGAVLWFLERRRWRDGRRTPPVNP